MTDTDPSFENVREMESKTFSAGPRTRFLDPSKVQLGYSTLNQIQAQNGANFVTLSQISEKERIEIIKTGFQLQAQGKISLKKYYQSTEELSLFQWKGYCIKYKSIRRTKLYPKLKGEYFH